MSAPIVCTPDGMPSRDGPAAGAERRSICAATVPVILAAMAVHSETVSGRAQCG